MPHTKIKVDICVAGGGSGGFGAACTAARSGLKVLLFEASDMLGGTSTVSGVNCWEPVRGASFGLPRELYGRMCKSPSGCGIYAPKLHGSQGREGCRNFPGRSCVWGKPRAMRRRWLSETAVRFVRSGSGICRN